jgi:hypothetical protein
MWHCWLCARRARCHETQHGRPGSSAHGQQAQIVSRDPASSPWTTAAQDALLNNGVAHDLLGHLRVADGQQRPPTRLRSIASKCLFVVGGGGDLRVEAAGEVHGRKLCMKKLRGISAALARSERHDHRGPERLPYVNTVLITAPTVTPWAAAPAGASGSGNRRARAATARGPKISTRRRSRGRQDRAWRGVTANVVQPRSPTPAG